MHLAVLTDGFIKLLKNLILKLLPPWFTNLLKFYFCLSANICIGLTTGIKAFLTLFPSRFKIFFIGFTTGLKPFLTLFAFLL